MNNYDVSVIVPIYNVEEYLRECLDSLLNQGDIRLEVVMIDDGSIDSSGDIADEYANKYPNYYCYHIENGGLGHARNYGIKNAHGKYVAFMDSDDIVTPRIYEKMFNIAERDNSEMAICNVARFNSTRSWSSSLHDFVFNNIETKSNLHKNYQFMYDTISCNKLIRKTFLDESGLQFPEKILYEDIPVTIPLHILANQISVLYDIGYLWRVRDGASKSITQGFNTINNLLDRIQILRLLDSFFESHNVDDTLKLQKEIKSLKIDLKIFVGACNKMEEEDALRVFEELNAYINEAVREEAFSYLSEIDQYKYQCIRNNDLAKLKKILQFQETNFSTMPVIEQDNKLMMEVPNDVFGKASIDITENLLETNPSVYIDRVLSESDRFELYCHLYYWRMNINNYSEQPIRAELFCEEQNVTVPLKVQPFKMSQLTKTRGIVVNKEYNLISKYNYDGSGFLITLPTEYITKYNLPNGEYKIMIHFENRIHKGKTILKGIDGAIQGKCSQITKTHQSSFVTIEFSSIKEILFDIRRDSITVEDISLSRDGVTISFSDEVDAALLENKNDKYDVVDAEKINDKSYFVSSNKMNQFAFYLIKYRQKESNYFKYAFDTEQQIFTKENETKALLYSSDRTNMPLISLREKAINVSKLNRIRHNISFTVKTKINELTNRAKHAKLCVEDDMAHRDVVLSSSTCKIDHDEIVNQFSIHLKNKKVTEDLYEGTRDVFVMYEDENNNQLFSDNLVSKEKISARANAGTIEVLLYRSMFGTIRLNSKRVWRKSEATRQLRDKQVVELYPKYRQKKLKENRILFESMWGSKYSCNPQALYEYIDEHYPQYECIWSFVDERTPIKGKGIRVRKGSKEYLYYLATSKYLVTNVNFDNYYQKREGQVVIETMHGTPLKSLGLDVASDFPTDYAREQYIEKNKNWDYLIVQGEFMKNKGYDCYRFEKEYLETGYPRTDSLFKANYKANIERIKKELNLPLDKKIILYAPTWRVKNRFDMMLDLQKMKERLSDEYIILIRIHHLSAKGYTIPADNKFIFDLNDYEYIENLYLISDILITDYSSVMFDYALLDKPMLFFVYDFEEYTEELRGIYVDFKEEAPGPLLFKADEVIQAIEHLDETKLAFTHKYNDFKNKYLSFENDSSCEKVIEAVMQPNQTKKTSNFLENIDRLITR